VTADLGVLTQRAELLTARINNTDDPYLRDNLITDRNNILAQIRSLQEPAA
jgi:hypothetical protein